MGKTIDPETKSIACFAEIDNLKKKNFVSNQFMEGEILVENDSVLSLPETAFLKSENEYFILGLEKETDESYYLKKEKVNTGRIYKNFIELTETPKSKKIVVQGIYNILVE